MSSYEYLSIENALDAQISEEIERLEARRHAASERFRAAVHSGDRDALERASEMHRSAAAGIDLLIAEQDQRARAHTDSAVAGGEFPPALW